MEKIQDSKVISLADQFALFYKTGKIHSAELPIKQPKACYLSFHIKTK